MSMTIKVSSARPNMPNPIIIDSLSLKLAVKRAAKLADSIYANMMVKVSTSVVLTILSNIAPSSTILAPQVDKEYRPYPSKCYIINDLTSFFIGIYSPPRIFAVEILLAHNQTSHISANSWV